MDAWDFVQGKGGVGFGDAVGEVDWAGGVFDDDGFKAEGFAVDSGVADAEVVGETAEEEALKATFTEIAGETGWGAVVVFEEGGVAVDVAAEAFAEDEFGVRNMRAGWNAAPSVCWRTVFGPESLRAVRGFDGFEGLLVVGGGEGDVLVGVPVLGEDDVLEFFSERC